MTKIERKQRIDELRQQVVKIGDALHKLKANCPHDVVKVGESASCSICRKDMGWWCPDSKDHQCDYTQADGSYNSDSCRWCGQPDERK